MSDFPPSKFLLGINPAARGAGERLVPARTAGRGARCCARLTSPPSSHLWAALAANPAGFVGAVSREKGASAPWWPSPPPSWPREALGADKRMQRQVQRPPPTAGERNLVWKSSFGGIFFSVLLVFFLFPRKRLPPGMLGAEPRVGCPWGDGTTTPDSSSPRNCSPRWVCALLAMDLLGLWSPPRGLGVCGS